MIISFGDGDEEAGSRAIEVVQVIQKLIPNRLAVMKNMSARPPRLTPMSFADSVDLTMFSRNWEQELTKPTVGIDYHEFRLGTRHTYFHGVPHRLVQSSI